MNGLVFRAAVANVALSHPDKHDCIVCRVARKEATLEEVARLVQVMGVPE